MKAALRLRVDRIACDGRGMCAELVPELIALDDWGYPILRHGIVPGELAAAAAEAAKVCPVLALHVERVAEGRPARQLARVRQAGSAPSSAAPPDLVARVCLSAPIWSGDP